MSICWIFFTAWRYASAVYAVVVCSSVRLSQAGIVSKPLKQNYSNNTTPQPRDSSTLVPTILAKFHRGHSQHGRQNRRRSACGLHQRRSSESWLDAQVYYTLVDCNLLTPLLRFALDLSYKLFLHCYAAVGKSFLSNAIGGKKMQNGTDVTDLLFHCGAWRANLLSERRENLIF